MTYSIMHKASSLLYSHVFIQRDRDLSLWGTIGVSVKEGRGLCPSVLYHTHPFSQNKRQM